MSDAPYGSPFTAMREALCDQFGIDYEREYGCGSPDSPCSCVPLANAIDQAEREVAALREALGVIIRHEESTDLIINIAGDALQPLLPREQSK